MTKITNSIEIEASPEKVFAWANDIKNMNEAMKGNAELEQTSNGPVGIGSTFHFVGAAAGQTAETDLQVTEYVKNKKFAFHSIGASKTKLAAQWTYEPTAKGTKLTIDTEYGVPYSILGKLIDKISIKKAMDKNNNTMLENIKKANETK